MGSLKESEASIQKSILDWGKVMRIPMRRMNVIGTPTKDGFRPAPNRGMADIHCELIIAGIPVSVWLECKTKRGKLSESQETFREGVNSYGGFYFVVRSIEDVQRSFNIIYSDPRLKKYFECLKKQLLKFL
tara:strand:+ start:318 stop:710 length:393 start_codon:yes stop_codon:yes gene_type:complete